LLQVTDLRCVAEVVFEPSVRLAWENTAARGHTAGPRAVVRRRPDRAGCRRATPARRLRAATECAGPPSSASDVSSRGFQHRRHGDRCLFAGSATASAVASNSHARSARSDAIAANISRRY
jgi:hypothetical protein